MTRTGQTPPRERWLVEGLAVLATEGADGVRIDRIAARLGLTKGSFHHHFDGVENYHLSLLERHEQEQLRMMKRVAAELQGQPPLVALQALPDLMSSLFDVDLERAVRAWAAGHPDARATQERLDSARLAFLEELWTRALGDGPRAHAAALIPHLVLIGATAAHPPLSPDELRAPFDLLAGLVPETASGDMD